MFKKSLLSIFFISSLMAAPSIGKAQILFQDDFESGNFLKWSMVWQKSRWSIVNDPTGSSNKVARVHFYQSATDGPAHWDDNEMLIAKPLNGVKRWFTRGYLYFPPDINWGGTKNDTIARKLLYFKGVNWDNNTSVWGAMIGGYYDKARNAHELTFGMGNHGGTAASIHGLGYISAGSWHCLELEIDISKPPGSHILRVWVNGIKTAERTNLNITGSNTAGLDSVEVGRQTDRFNHNGVDEYRYWDNIVISTNYVGLADSTAPIATGPKPPKLHLIQIR
jgi:hypothetical protein